MIVVYVRVDYRMCTFVISFFYLYIQDLEKGKNRVQVMIAIIYRCSFKSKLSFSRIFGNVIFGNVDFLCNVLN